MTVSIWTATTAGLMPGDVKAAELCRKLKVGQQVRAEITRIRSPDQLRLWWALMDKAVDNQGFYANAEDLSDAVKCHLGHCYTLTLPTGATVQRPKSIALGNMGQDEFNALFDAAQKLIAATLGVTVEDLNAEILPASAIASETVMAG